MKAAVCLYQDKVGTVVKYLQLGRILIAPVSGLNSAQWMDLGQTCRFYSQKASNHVLVGKGRNPLPQGDQNRLILPMQQHPEGIAFVQERIYYTDIAYSV